MFPRNRFTRFEFGTRLMNFERDRFVITYQMDRLGQQLTPARSLRRVLPGTENDVASHRIGEGSDSLRGGGGAGIRMNPHAAEVTAEPGLHETAHAGRQRRP